MIAEIRRLNPKPGLAFGSTVVQPIVPDVFVRAGAGRRLASSSSTPTRCRRCWSTRATTPRSRRPPKNDSDKTYLADCLQTATWLMRALDQRAKTILKVSTEIVRQQDAFFAHGVQHLRPLNLKTVADAISMHESTVSRVTANKYMATSRGIFELKYFFTSSIAASDGGEAHSAEAVRHRIKQLIDAESARRRAVRRHHRREACARPASTSRAAPSPNTARRCGSRRRCSAGARSRRRPARIPEKRGQPVLALTRVDVAVPGCIQAELCDQRLGRNEQRRQTMPFRVSGKNHRHRRGVARARQRPRRRSARANISTAAIPATSRSRRRASAFAPNARSISIPASRCTPRRIAADAYASADQAALRIEKRLRRYKRRLKDHHAGARQRHAPTRRSTRRATSSRRPRTTTTTEVDRVQSGDHRGIDHRAEAAVGQRSGDGTRHDRRAGRGVPPRRPRPDQSGLPPPDGNVGWIDPPAIRQSEAH